MLSLNFAPGGSEVLPPRPSGPLLPGFPPHRSGKRRRRRDEARRLRLHAPIPAEPVRGRLDL